MTDQQLKALFPKLLPGRVKLFTIPDVGMDGDAYDVLKFIDEENHVDDWNVVQDNQLLSLCREVEKTFTKDERIKYIELLWKKSPSYVKDGYNWNQAALANLIWWTLAHASWQQRIQAAAEVRGIL